MILQFYGQFEKSTKCSLGFAKGVVLVMLAMQKHKVIL